VPKLIDSHAHLEELGNLGLALERAKGVGVISIVAVGSSPDSNQEVLRISEKYRSFVYPALGLHPWEVGRLQAEQIELALKFIEENIAEAIGIGEVGLDYDKRVAKVSSKEQQKDIFRSLLEIAREYKKPVIIHSRYAWKDAFDMVKKAKVTEVIFHWYTGFSSVLRNIIEEGYFISATPAAEYHYEHQRAIKEMPLPNLLLETDCPVLYGREERYSSEPADVVRSLKAVSALKGILEAEVARQTTQNAIRLFGLNLT
jgi:TatD DNase family protein